MAGIAAVEHIDGRPIDVVAAERPQVICDYCREAIVHDGEIWRHVRTGLSADWRSKECHPPCRYCDKEGTRAVGADRSDGSGIRFYIEYFVCAEHARRNGPFIERT
jgi:hypothetical protein